MSSCFTLYPQETFAFFSLCFLSFIMKRQEFHWLNEITKGEGEELTKGGLQKTSPQSYKSGMVRISSLK